MAITTGIKTYLTIFLIGVVLIIAGISIYAVTQPDTSQTPSTIYKELTEAEEKIVQDNIRSSLQQQRKIETENVVVKQPSYVNNEPKQDYKPDYRQETSPEEPAYIVNKSDTPIIVPSDKQVKNGANHANSDNFDELLKEFGTKDLDLGKGKSSKSISNDDLSEVIAELKASGNFSKGDIIKIKKSIDVGDGKWVEVEIDDK